MLNKSQQANRRPRISPTRKYWKHQFLWASPLVKQYVEEPWLGITSQYFGQNLQKILDIYTSGDTNCMECIV